MTDVTGADPNASMRGPAGATGPTGPCGPTGADGEDGRSGRDAPLIFLTFPNEELAVNVGQIAAFRTLSDQERERTKNMWAEGVPPSVSRIDLKQGGFYDVSDTFEEIMERLVMVMELDRG